MSSYKKNIISLLLWLLASCASVAPERTSYVLEYKGFGPPVIATELLGVDWWQWQNHGGSRPETYAIKVVVYHNIERAQIERRYPVVPSKNQDYRYIEYHEAIKYLDERIAENVMEQVTDKLINTRNKIILSMGESATGR